MEKIFDKSSKKYLENLFSNYFQVQRGFNKPYKLNNGINYRYFEITKNGYQNFMGNITKNKWGFYECYLTFAKRINEHAKILIDIFDSKYNYDEEVNFQTISIIIGAPRDLKDLYNYDDGIITTGGEFEMYDYEDADRYFAAAIKIFEQFAEPFFKQIQTVEDVDMWYNACIYNGEKAAMEKYRDDSDLIVTGWKALIASRLAKNPKYQLLEDFMRSIIKYPRAQEEFESIINYFKTNN